MSDDIGTLKAQLRDAVVAYRNQNGRSDHLNCGANLRAVFRPELALTARTANELAAKLQALDPAFPTNWIPYPEGT
ncbi:MAG: hypothetical protein V4641_05440 [Pseudomonadota bacterium]